MSTPINSRAQCALYALFSLPLCIGQVHIQLVSNLPQHGIKLSHQLSYQMKLKSFPHLSTQQCYKQDDKIKTMRNYQAMCLKNFTLSPRIIRIWYGIWVIEGVLRGILRGLWHFLVGVFSYLSDCRLAPYRYPLSLRHYSELRLLFSRNAPATSRFKVNYWNTDTTYTYGRVCGRILIKGRHSNCWHISITHRTCPYPS